MYLLISIPLFQFIPFRQFSYLLPWPVRSPACRRVFYPPWGKIHPRCPTVASRVHRRNTSDDTPTPALSLPLAMVPILGRSPRISSQNACHTNNIQHFHITFTRKRQDSTRLLIIDTRRFSFFFSLSRERCTTKFLTIVGAYLKKSSLQKTWPFLAKHLSVSLVPQSRQVRHLACQHLSRTFNTYLSKIASWQPPHFGIEAVTKRDN